MRCKEMLLPRFISAKLAGHRCGMDPVARSQTCVVIGFSVLHCCCRVRDGGFTLLSGQDRNCFITPLPDGSGQVGFRPWSLNICLFRFFLLNISIRQFQTKQPMWCNGTPLQVGQVFPLISQASLPNTYYQLLSLGIWFESIHSAPSPLSFAGVMRSSPSQDHPDGRCRSSAVDVCDFKICFPGCSGHLPRVAKAFKCHDWSVHCGCFQWSQSAPAYPPNWNCLVSGLISSPCPGLKLWWSPCFCLLLFAEYFIRAFFSRMPCSVWLWSLFGLSFFICYQFIYPFLLVIYKVQSHSHSSSVSWYCLSSSFHPFAGFRHRHWLWGDSCMKISSIFQTGFTVAVGIESYEIDIRIERRSGVKRKSLQWGLFGFLATNYDKWLPEKFIADRLILPKNPSIWRDFAKQVNRGSFFYWWYLFPLLSGLAFVGYCWLLYCLQVVPGCFTCLSDILFSTSSSTCNASLIWLFQVI